MTLYVIRYAYGVRSTLLRPLARRILTPILKYALDTHLVVGTAGVLMVGDRVALANAILNLSSGSITLGDRTILSHGVMLVTGRHDFLDGKRASLPSERDDGSWGEELSRYLLLATTSL